MGDIYMRWENYFARFCYSELSEPFSTPLGSKLPLMLRLGHFLDETTGGPKAMSETQ